MKALRLMAAQAFRVFALIVVALVLYFPAYKNTMIAYGPVLIGLAVVVALHQKLKDGWACAPLQTLSNPAFFALALGGPALLQLGLVLLLRPMPSFDGQFVYDEAVALVQTGRMSPLTYYPPLQTWWYAGWFKCFGISPLVAQLSHIPLHALVTGLTFGFARATVARHARLAALGVAYYPSFLGYVLATPYYHYLYTAMIVATAWGWVAALRRARCAALAGLASGLGALAKATQLIAPAQAMMFWMLVPHEDAAARPARALAVRTGLFLAVMALVIAPWTARNQRVFGEPVLVCTSGGLVLHSANNPESNGLYSGLPDAVEIDSPAAMLAHSRASAAQAKQFMFEHPVRFIELALVKILHTWGGEATFAELINRGGASLGRVEDLFSGAFFMGWVLVAGLWGSVSLTALRSRLPLDPIEWAAAVTIFSNAAVYAVFEGGDRHHLPLVPLIVVATLALAERYRQTCAAASSSAPSVPRM